jgi:hypothetical protein
MEAARAKILKAIEESKKIIAGPTIELSDAAVPSTCSRPEGTHSNALPAFTGSARQLLFEHSPGRAKNEAWCGHQSQGSKYPAVVIPVTTQHQTMLQRNLLHTGVIRGERLAFLLGQKKGGSSPSRASQDDDSRRN